MSSRLGMVVAAAAVGGLLLAGAATFDWVVQVEVREVGGVPLEEVEATPGIDLAPNLVPAGLLATLGALVVAALPARWRPVGGWLLAAVGVGGVGVAGWGLVEALRLTGTITAAPALGFVGAGLVAGGGTMLALRPPVERHVLDEERFTVEGVQDGGGDDEWDLASLDEED